MKKTRSTWFYLVFCIFLAITTFSMAEDPKAMEELVSNWEEAYKDKFGWILDDSYVGAALPDTGDVQQKDALQIVIDAICRIEEVDLSFFQGYRPFFAYTENKVWMISILPETTLDNPPRAFFIEVDGLTGELIKYTPGDVTQAPFQLTDKPKG